MIRIMVCLLCSRQILTEPPNSCQYYPMECMQNEVMDGISNFSVKPTFHHLKVSTIHSKESDAESLDFDKYQPSEYKLSPLQKIVIDHS